MKLETDVERARVLDRFDRLSELLDSRYRLPLTNIRLGWDPIAGLVPIRGLIARMLANVAVDSVIGAIPFVGALFDLFFRANDRNFRLMLQHLEKEMARGGDTGLS